MSCGKPHEIIVGSGDIRDILPAGGACMDDHPALLAALIECRRHHAGSAGGQPVAGAVTVHVFAPQAVGTVVAIASALQFIHVLSTVHAREGLLSCDERHVSRVRGKRERMQTDLYPCGNSRGTRLRL